MSSLVENRRHIATVLSRASFAQSTLWLNHGRETAGCLRPAPAAAEIDEIEEVAPRLGAYDGGLPAMAISKCVFPVQVPPTTIRLRLASVKAPLGISALANAVSNADCHRAASSCRLVADIHWFLIMLIRPGQAAICHCDSAPAEGFRQRSLS